MLTRRILQRLASVSVQMTGVQRASSYETGASHELLNEQSSNIVELPYYNEKQVRNWLSQYKGGSVTLEKNEDTGFATLLIQNDGKKNAFTGNMMYQLSECVHSLQEWDHGKVLVIMGANGDFCSGGDLGFMEAIATPKLGCRMSIFMQEITSSIYRLPLLTVALIQGNALGGGAELAMACDLRVFGGQRAKLGFVQARLFVSRLGVSTGWGGGTHLVRLIGPKNAFRLLIGGSMLEGEGALKSGVIDHLIPEEDTNKLQEALHQWLHTNYLQFAFYHLGYPNAMKAMKRMVFNVHECTYPEVSEFLDRNYCEAHLHRLSQALNRERDIFMRRWGSSDHKAAIENIKARLKP